MSPKYRVSLHAVSAAILILISLPAAFAQGKLADYERGQELRAKARGLVVNMPGTAVWIGDTEHFWYTNTVKGGTEFLLVDAVAGSKKPAFDHAKLAAAIYAASGGKYTALTLPFAAAKAGAAAAGGRAQGRRLPAADVHQR